MSQLTQTNVHRLLQHVQIAAGCGTVRGELLIVEQVEPTRVRAQSPLNHVGLSPLDVADRHVKALVRLVNGSLRHASIHQRPLARLLRRRALVQGLVANVGLELVEPRGGSANVRLDLLDCTLHLGKSSFFERDVGRRHVDELDRRMRQLGREMGYCLLNAPMHDEALAAWLHESVTLDSWSNTRHAGDRRTRAMESSVHVPRAT